jgi:hypothetical protein
MIDTLFATACGNVHQFEKIVLVWSPVPITPFFLTDKKWLH